MIDQAKDAAAMPDKAAWLVKLGYRAAGKPFTVDEFKTDELIATGTATSDDIPAPLETDGIRWIPKTLPTGAEASVALQ